MLEISGQVASKTRTAAALAIRPGAAPDVARPDGPRAALAVDPAGDVAKLRQDPLRPPLAAGEAETLVKGAIADEGGDGGAALAASLTPEEKAIVAKMSARDREVRNHEEAHAAVGGQYAGAPSYEFAVGPDGRRYAVAGSVAIDVSPVRGDPEATIDKMEIVKAAALAPAEPSGQDRRVAAQATANQLAAVAELNALRNAEQAQAQSEGDRFRIVDSDFSAREPGGVQDLLPFVAPMASTFPPDFDIRA